MHVGLLSEIAANDALKALKPKFTKGPYGVPAFVVQALSHLFRNMQPTTVIKNGDETMVKITALL